MIYTGHFRTFSLELDFALHSKVIIFTIIALALDVVHLTTIHPFYLHFRTPLLSAYRLQRRAACHRQHLVHLISPSSSLPFVEYFCRIHPSCYRYA